MSTNEAKAHQSPAGKTQTDRILFMFIYVSPVTFAMSRGVLQNPRDLTTNNQQWQGKKQAQGGEGGHCANT